MGRPYGVGRVIEKNLPSVEQSVSVSHTQTLWVVMTLVFVNWYFVLDFAVISQQEPRICQCD